MTSRPATSHLRCQAATGLLTLLGALWIAPGAYASGQAKSDSPAGGSRDGKANGRTNGNVNGKASGKMNDKTDGKRSGETDTHPFEIRLTGTGSTLKAVLVNRSTSAVPVLHHIDLQPSQLKLLSSAGKKQRYSDNRAVMKFDNTPYCHLWQTLAPGHELELGTVQLKPTAGGYSASWGPYVFETIPAGDYQAQVVWRSELDQCLDEGSTQLRKLPGGWTGVVTSNELALHLR